MNPNKVQVNTTRQGGGLKFNSNVNIGVDERLTYGPTSVTGWFNGLSPDGATGYVNYINKVGSQGPTIYRPLNDSDYIAATKQVFGLSSNPGNLRTAASYWFDNAGYLSTNFNYPNLRTVELIFAIDTKYFPSWDGLSTTKVKDGISSGDCPIKGTVKTSKTATELYESMDMGFSGPTQAIVTPSLTNVRTISMWVYIPSSTYDSQSYLIYGNSGGRISEANGINGFAGSPYSINGAPYQPLSSATDLVGNQNQWVNLIFTTISPLSGVFNLMNNNLWSKGLRGNLGGVFMWDDVLTEDEVANHFEAFRAQYGL